MAAMHALLGRARSRLVLISPYDVVGERRQPNLPGTVDQYPNWRIRCRRAWRSCATTPGCGW